MAKKPYVVDLADVGSETLVLEGAFAPGDIDFSGDDLEQVDVLEWSASVETRGGGARLSGRLRVRIRLACVRCVEPVDQSVDRAFDLFFEQEADSFDEHDEVELGESDTATAFLGVGELSMDQVMHEQVVLAVPMKPLCSTGCRGLCPDCGANLNTDVCDCARPVVNAAFEPLLELKKKLEGRGRFRE